MTRFASRWGVAVLAAAGLAGAAQAQTAAPWPTRPVRLIVSYTPGGPVDTLARLVGARAEKELGQPVLIDNKPGASGATGIIATIQGEPDGYLYGIGVLGVLTVLPHIGTPPFKTEDVNYVTLLTKSPHALAVAPEHGIASLKGLIDAARRNPGKLNYGSSGTGSSTHLDGELFAQEARVDILHVPYKGAADFVKALVANDIQMAAAEVSAVRSLAPRIQIVALLDQKRLPQLPDVPTASELGFPNLVSHSVYGVIAPNKTPAALTERFRKAVTVALNAAEVRDKLLAAGMQPSPSSPEEYRNYMIAESAKWGALIRNRNLKIE